MNQIPAPTPDQVRYRITTTDRLLRAIAALTPREATFFLLNFDACFARVTGCEATDTQRLVIMSALRRQATQSA